MGFDQPKDLREEWKKEQKKVDPIEKLKNEVKQQVNTDTYMDAIEKQDSENQPKSPYDDIHDAFDEETQRGNIDVEKIVNQEDVDDKDAILNEELYDENEKEKGMN